MKLGLVGPIIGTRVPGNQRREGKSTDQQTVVCFLYWSNIIIINYCVEIKPVQICHSNYFVRLKLEGGERPSRREFGSVSLDWVGLTSFQYQVPPLVSKANRMERSIGLSKIQSILNLLEPRDTSPTISRPSKYCISDILGLPPKSHKVQINSANLSSSTKIHQNFPQAMWGEVVRCQSG